MRTMKSLAVTVAAAVLGGGAAVLAPVSTASAFCSEAELAAGVAARGVEGREPDLGQLHEDLPESAKGKAGRRLEITVPVYFHVVTDGSLGALTGRQIDAQIGVLNNTYAGGEGGADAGFSFELAAVTRTDNAEWFYANSGGAAEHSMKQTLRAGGADALNLYSTSAGEYLGWAYLPSILTKPNQAHLDGVVIDWKTMPGTSTFYAGQFDQGETATHEVGHWLSLEHTFNGGCNAKGDFVDDTPPQRTPTDGCPEGKDTCRAPGPDPIHNYMDYSYDSCYTEFTAGQVQRMKDAWLLYRAGGG